MYVNKKKAIDNYFSRALNFNKGYNMGRNQGLDDNKLIKKPIKMATGFQLSYIKKHFLSKQQRISRQYAYVLIKDHKDKNKSNFVTAKIPEIKASPKLKKFLMAKKIDFDLEISREDAVSMIMELGFSVNPDDSIEKD